jgi:hypothetical protein
MRTQPADPRFSNRNFKKGKDKSKCAAMPDVPHLIRSIQRLDGNPDCFGKAVLDCSRACPWREYCLPLAEKVRTKNKDDNGVLDDERPKDRKRKTQR